MIESIKKQTYFVILISAALPLLIYCLISFNQYKKYVYSAAGEQIESIRDEWLEGYRSEYYRVFERLDLIVYQSGSLLLSSGIDESSEFDDIRYIESLLEEEKSITEVAFFDDSYIPVFKVNSTGLININIYNSDVRIALQEIVFSKSRVTSDIQLPDGTSALYVFYKLVVSGKTRGYVSWKMSYNWLENTLPGKSNRIRNIYNAKYQLIASNTDLVRWSAIITDQTERMLNGFTETGVYEDELHSYGFVDLGETAIYGDIIIPLNTLSSSLGKVISTSVFFILFTLFLAVVFAWSFSGKLVRYGESVLINKHYTSEMKFFGRMKGNINMIREDAKSVTEIQTRLGYLLNDISVILEHMPEESDDEAK